VVAIRAETPHAKTFRLALSAPSPFLAGQHYVVRLTAPDGYTASRSYSVASAPDDEGEIELTVEHLPEGEVSGFLDEVVQVGDVLHTRIVGSPHRVGSREEGTWPRTPARRPPPDCGADSRSGRPSASAWP